MGWMGCNHPVSHKSGRRSVQQRSLAHSGFPYDHLVGFAVTAQYLHHHTGLPVADDDRMYLRSFGRRSFVDAVFKQVDERCAASLFEGYGCRCRRLTSAGSPARLSPGGIELDDLILADGKRF